MQQPEVEAFLEMLVATRGAAHNTVVAYQQDLRQFSSFLEGKSGSSIPLVHVSSDHINRYLIHLSREGREAATLSRHLSSLRQFYQFLVSEGWATHNPTLNLDAPRSRRPLPKVLSEEEITRLLEAARTQTHPEGCRLYALLEVLYASGLRVSELVCLPLTSIHPDRPFLLIKGKGGKERLVPLSKPALNALQAYLAIRPAFLEKGSALAEKWLFPSSSKEGHLTRQRFGQLLKELALAANLDPAKVSPHIIRHAFATHLLRGGADLLSIQKLLGHADLSTTQIYTHVATDHLKDLVNTHHPLAHSSQGNALQKGSENP
jgi:integrase/recombinase XerD